MKGAGRSPVFTRLTEGGQLLIWAMRQWMVAMLQRRCVPVSVMRSFETVGGARVFRSMTAMVLLAARDADRPLLIHPPCREELSADEERIAEVLAALRRGSITAARVHLCALIDDEPSAALQRHAQIVADCFRCAGLPVGIEGPVEWQAPATNR